MARVAADPTRLRLLALCAEKPFNVAELAAIVGQSDPLVSHHLKALLAAGVLVKKRRGKRMEYRLTAERASQLWVRALLATLDPSDTRLRADREAAERWSPPTIENGVARASAAGATRMDRALVEFLRRPAGTSADTARCLVDSVRMNLLTAAAGLAQSVDVLVRDAASAAKLRSAFTRRGVDNAAVLTAGLATAESRYDAAVLDYSELVSDAPGGIEGSIAARIEFASRRLAAGAMVWLFTAYDALDLGSGREHPLMRLRRLLSEQGFACNHLQPIEADGHHVLAATAVFRPSATRVA
ncbi:MAG: metalloregulator ArsR/SmtB family transcription factor [Steroidobacteraceae bacterium]